AESAGEGSSIIDTAPITAGFESAGSESASAFAATLQEGLAASAGDGASIVDTAPITSGFETAGSESATAFTSSLQSGISGSSFDASSLGIDTSGLSSSFSMAGTDAANALSSAVSSGTPGISSALSTAGTEGMTAFSGAVSSGAGEISGQLSSLGGDMASTMSGAFDSMKESATSSMSAMKGTLISEAQGAAAAIKSAFEGMTITIPQPKIPEINVSYTTEGKGEAKVEIPHFSVVYHAEGGILDDPTLIGMAGNVAHVAGEAGAEAILPLDSFYDKVESIVSGNSQQKVTSLSAGSGSDKTTVNASGGTFAPNISVSVGGNMDDQAQQNLMDSLYDTVKHLFEEFRNEEIEQMALKNSFALP
ncbi:MAG: hypothetical protein IJ799_01595, partial [Bacteroidales bacterium]|nr:hypothetical protein [Bacteroidales bacterium]